MIVLNEGWTDYLLLQNLYRRHSNRRDGLGGCENVDVTMFQCLNGNSWYHFLVSALMYHNDEKYPVQWFSHYLEYKIDRNDEHSKKASGPILVTPIGIFTDIKDEQR